MEAVGKLVAELRSIDAERITLLRIARTAGVATGRWTLDDRAGAALLPLVHGIRKTAGIDLVQKGKLNDVPQPRTQCRPRNWIDDPARARRHRRNGFEPAERADALRLTIEERARLTRGSTRRTENQPALLIGKQHRPAQHFGLIVPHQFRYREQWLAHRQAGTGLCGRRLQHHQHNRNRRRGEPAPRQRPAQGCRMPSRPRQSRPFAILQFCMLGGHDYLSWWFVRCRLGEADFTRPAAHPLSDQVFRSVDVRLSEIDDDDLATLVGVKAAVVGNGGA
jgi:hypothetical protein